MTQHAHVLARLDRAERAPMHPTPNAARSSRGRAWHGSAWLLGGALALALAGAHAPRATAQVTLGGDTPTAPPPSRIVAAAAAPVTIAAGARAEAMVTLTIAHPWHINANPPSPDYMIPTEVAIAGEFGITPGRAAYPTPKRLKVAFDQSELAVYNERVTVRVPLDAAAIATNGAHTLKGTVRFQSCNEQVCMTPASVPFTIAVTVWGGAAAGSAAAGGGSASDSASTEAGGANTGAGADSGGASAGAGSDARAASPRPSGGFATGPPPSGTLAALDNPLARKLASGSWGAFLTLFLIGLALNLTPCVYPMLGVTVSIFGARRAAPPLQVAGYAVLYVLGMAVMYTALGVTAAFTGGLFGGLLQNAWVNVGIGLLLIALSLSMFGLYELQLPPALMMRLGGATATSAVGTFLSGLVVGVFAAPCIGAPVVALLAIVGAKGDPWFGFKSFFTLAMGLGAPYLVLGTFSNLLQTLPRSGEWMVWVKKVFGVVVIAVGAFYLSLVFAPDLGRWIVPAALVVGGLYLGFFEKSADRRAGFRWLKRLGGAAATLAGVVAIVTTPTVGVAFEDFSATALDAAMKSGQPAMLDFTANWCAPCHELERFTFTDRKVRDSAKRFRAFRVDLTHYDSPEAEAWRKRYGITGVPTVVFLAPDGSEVRESRVEGFLAPARFLERMERAATAGALGMR